MGTEIFTQVVQTERVSQTSRSVYLYGVSLRNAESYLLNQQKIFLKNNFRNQSEKIRWDSCVNGARLFTRNMQSTQPFQLKKVIQRIYNKLIMIRTSFLANFKLTFWNKHSLTVVYGAVGLITKALLLRHQIKEQRIQKLSHNFVVNPDVVVDSGRFLPLITVVSSPVCRQNSSFTFWWLRRPPFAKVGASIHEFDRDLVWIACSVHCRFAAFFSNSATLALGRCGRLPSWTVAVVITTLGCCCVCESRNKLFNWTSDGSDADLFRAISDLWWA